MAYNLLYNINTNTTTTTTTTVSKSCLTILGSAAGSGCSRTSPSPITSSIAFSKRSTQQLCLRSRGISRVSAAEDNTGGGGGGGNYKGGGGGGSGDDNNNNNNNKDDQGDNEDDPQKKKMATGMSMSQKLTLGYAALVGVGGVMGYVKSGSQKSLTAGGLSALLLYYVHTELPVRPALASSIGFGISAALLAVMGSRFKRSGKIFPAGVVSLFSLIMTGGYLHGILRSTHV